ncbi:hypothetical protein [Pedobacter sp. NJ-S-72]
MQQEYILHNDQYIAVDQAILTAKNRGFRYGDGLFESMRMSGGKLKFAELHADRLQAGMNECVEDGRWNFV